MRKGENMNISPVSYKTYSSVQNQNTHQSPNFKSTLVTILPKNNSEHPALMNETLKRVLSVLLGISTGKNRLSAEKGRRFYVWLDGTSVEELTRTANELTGDLQELGVRFKALKGIPKAIRERAAEIARGKQSKMS